MFGIFERKHNFSGDLIKPKTEFANKKIDFYAIGTTFTGSDATIIIDGKIADTVRAFRFETKLGEITLLISMTAAPQIPVRIGRLFIVFRNLINGSMVQCFKNLRFDNARGMLHSSDIDCIYEMSYKYENNDASCTPVPAAPQGNYLSDIVDMLESDDTDVNLIPTLSAIVKEPDAPFNQLMLNYILLHD